MTPPPVTDEPDLLAPLRNAPKPDEHPRDLAIEAAGGEFLERFQAVIAKYNLTTFETLHMVATVLRSITRAACLAEREAKQK